MVAATAFHLWRGGHSAAITLLLLMAAFVAYMRHQCPAMHPARRVSNTAHGPAGAMRDYVRGGSAGEVVGGSDNREKATRSPEHGDLEWRRSN